MSKVKSGLSGTPNGALNKTTLATPGLDGWGG
jgi:hypothetical protein